MLLILRMYGMASYIDSITENCCCEKTLNILLTTAQAILIIDNKETDEKT